MGTLRKQIRTFALAVLAGAAIGIGGMVYLSVENKVAGALMFTVGLYTICVHGLNLYTGKIGYLPEQLSCGRLDYLMDLFVIWLGNLAGTGLTAAAIAQTRADGMAEAARSVCEPKMKDGLLSLFILAVFCGFLMYVAVDGYRQTKNPAILFMGVAAFILCGFEHCIADMFYFSAAGIWSGRAARRIAVITLGNSAGGVLIPLIKNKGNRMD